MRKMNNELKKCFLFGRWRFMIGNYLKSPTSEQFDSQNHQDTEKQSYTKAEPDRVGPEESRSDRLKLQPGRHGPALKEVIS